MERDTRRAPEELAERLRPFVARRVPPGDVDDVLQDVFLRMQRGLENLEDEQRLLPFLYRVARSAIVENHRQRARHPLACAAPEAHGTPAQDSGEPSPIEQELAAYLLSYVAALPSPYREALTLTELEGLSQQAAADATGISLSGMKSRVQRGRVKLRELLEACCRIRVDARGRVIACEPRDPSDCRCRSAPDDD
jgi:RNA polymerase sigma-70 factor (ECF subfamily)